MRRYLQCAWIELWPNVLSNLMFSNAQLCHRLSWGHQQVLENNLESAQAACSLLIEITYQRGIPDTSFTCLHLTGSITFKQPLQNTVWRKTNGIPIWHSVKKNDVKIATIGWQLHCRQEIQIRRHICLVEFHVACSFTRNSGCPWQVRLSLWVPNVFV